MTKLAAMVEAERRGILPAEHQALLAEARRRGLISDTADQYQGWGDYANDLGRTALQGASMSFGDEITAGVRSALSSELDYDRALAEERDALARFRRQNPGTALAAEFAGGMAMPGLGAARTIAAAPTLAGKVLRSGAIGAGYGGVAGYGAGEGGVDDRLNKALEGAQFGAVLGGAAPVAARQIGRAVTGAETVAAQAKDAEKAARLYLADRLRQNGLDEQQIQAELARGQEATQFANGAAALPETIADVKPTTQRVLRGIKVGGEADNVIEPFLGNRQSPPPDFTRGAEAGGQYQRLNEDLRLAMKLSDEASADKVAKAVDKRKSNADANFAAARANSEAFNLRPVQMQYTQEALNMANPDQRKGLLDAIRLFNDESSSEVFSKLWSSGSNARSVGVTNIDRFHQAKMALDDAIASAGASQQGNLKRLLTGLKHDMLNAVFKYDSGGAPTLNKDYHKALNAYATESQLINAEEFGRAVANGTEQLTPRIWRSMSEPEKNMVRRVYNEKLAAKMGGKAAGPTTDFTGALRSPNMGDDLRVLLPPVAGRSASFPGGNREKLTELVRREHRMSGTANKVLGNSSTAEKAVDAIDVGRMGRALRYIKDSGGLTMAAVGSLQETLEKMAAIKGPRAQYLARKLVSIDPAEQQAFLQEVAATFNQSTAQAIIKAMDYWVGHVANSLAGAGARAQTPEFH